MRQVNDSRQRRFNATKLHTRHCLLFGLEVGSVWFSVALKLFCLESLLRLAFYASAPHNFRHPTVSTPGRCKYPRNAATLQRGSVVIACTTPRRCSVVRRDATPRRCRCHNKAATLQRRSVVGSAATLRRCLLTQRRGAASARTTPRRCNVVVWPLCFSRLNSKSNPFIVTSLYI